MANRHSVARVAIAAAAVAALVRPASAQIDPLQFMKTVAPNVVFVVDTANRMQRDAPTDPSTLAQFNATSNYYDPFLYSRGTNVTAEMTLGVTALNTTSKYRRLYKNLTLSSSASPDKFNTSTITVTRDQDAGYALFDAPSRMAIVRAAIYQAVTENKNVARFGLVRMRQKTPTPATVGNSGPVVDADGSQNVAGTTEAASGRWNISRPTVAANNGSQNTSGLVVQADSGTANSDILSIVSHDARQIDGGSTSAKTLLPAGNDDANTLDAPVKYMLDDAKSEVTRLIGINNDPACRNTIVVLMVGGGEGTTASGMSNTDLANAAASFVAISGRRVPIYVIALEPPTTDVATLQSVAAKSGGQYFQITRAQMQAALTSTLQKATAGVSAPAGTVIVPEVVNAIDTAVQHAFATSTDFTATPAAASLPRADATQPLGAISEFQVTSPIVSTVNLNNAKDITGAALYSVSTQPPNVKDKQGNVIPQRNNVMVTTAVGMPGFDARLRGFLVYRPVADATQPTGWKFTNSNCPGSCSARLWVASTPSDTSLRNLYTSDAAGNLIAFTTANAATLMPLMGLTDVNDVTSIISNVRSLNLGAVIDSTPGFLNPPSLDPPPDDAYPGFAVANKDRRTLIWVGTNRGVLEAIDARTGLEVWGFIPLNLLPKLRTLRDGQPVGNFDFFADGSPKISDVKLAGICDADHPTDCWRTHLIVGEGAGGTFYQSFDVTMTGLSTCIAPDNDTQATLLGCFNSTSRITLNWAFPSYTSFDPTASVAVHCDPVTGACDSLPYGDLKSTATAVEKSVGQTWSDPAVGQVSTTAGPYSVLLGSGFLPYATQHQANRGDIVAGTTFYVVDAKTGAVYSSMSVGSDGLSETVNNCASQAIGCKQIKNALQTDPVATGPSDSRFITKAYLGDLDGNVWRFDMSLDGSSHPTITTKNKLYAIGAGEPIFQSMATVNVGGTQQYVFMGTGSDLLPGTDKNTIYHLLAVLDTGAATGTQAFSFPLVKTNTLSQDERVTAFPAVAGDIVFFTTTTFATATPCTAPNANLYAFTFSGGAAYDTNNDGKFSNQDSVLVKTIAGQRATAPFIVDQHLMFGYGSNVAMFGDPDDFNNGVGQAGVRILSWREVR